jgi:hypothetical protein
MYSNVNFKTKKALREAVESGRKIGIHQVGPFGGNEPREGTVCIEGPWYPQPHRWYATATVKDGVIVKVR